MKSNFNVIMNKWLLHDNWRITDEIAWKHFYEAGLTSSKSKFDKVKKEWLDNDCWRLTDQVAWRYFFDAGIAAQPPKSSDMISISKEDLTRIHELLFEISLDKDGSFFICEEASDLIEEVNQIINRLI